MTWRASARLGTLPHRSVLICCLPRSGSWLLAEALELTGSCGHPREYFRPDYEPTYAAAWCLPEPYDYNEFLGAVRRAGTTPNGVFAAKLHWSQYEYLASRLDRSVDPLERDDVIRGQFPQPAYIHLRRLDTQAQAVSWYRAIVERVWWKLDGPSPATRRPLPAVPDFGHIAELERTLIDQERCWQRFFRGTGSAPVEVTYEELAGCYPQTVGRVLDALQIDQAAASGEVSRLQRQADEISQEWISHYRRYRRDHGCVPAS